MTTVKRKQEQEKSTIVSQSTEEIEGIIRELSVIRTDMIKLATTTLGAIAPPDAMYQASAHNLLHYLALRGRDLRPLQNQLAALGLSSLGRAEAHVLASVDAVLRALHRLVLRPWIPPELEGHSIDFNAGQRLLAEHTEALLGPAPPHRATRIMVTMPGEAATDYTLVHDLLRHGMDCMRINCAHDDAQAWSGMIAHLRKGENTLGRTCRILMDLGGPKLRTGPLEPGPSVLKWRPTRDRFGRVTAPARIWLTAQERPVVAPTPADGILPVPADWLDRLSAGDRIMFTDTRDASRELLVVTNAPGGCWCEAYRTAYVTPGLLLYHKRAAKNLRHPRPGVPVGYLPPQENAIILRQGDLLLLAKELVPGRQAILDSVGRVLSPAQISCTLPEVFGDISAGERVWLDDGKIGGVVEKTESDCLHLRITHARPSGEKLRSDKGINFPDSALQLPALTDKDITDLEFVSKHADMIGLSFVNSVADVVALDAQLTRIGGRRPGIILKIETQRGFEQLPAMLLAAMKTPCAGVMIARGDLAVECGYERLAEVQEEILWVCEAAHFPVIWATQVLENLAKEGIPSRAEITDAAMGDRAECVMLNKGPHIVQAVQVLDDILQRMQAHQLKKRSMLRELHLAHAFLNG